MKLPKLMFLLTTCFVSSVGAQTDDFLFDSQPGLTAAVVKEISSAKKSVDAFKTSLYGRTSVHVLIDAAGNVSSVERVSGPGNICQSVTRPDVVAARSAAANAARMVKFVPAKMGDQPVASAGWLYFRMGKPEPAATDDDREVQRYSASNAPPKIAEEKRFSASNAPPKIAEEKRISASNAPPKVREKVTGAVIPPNSDKISPEPDRFTVKSEAPTTGPSRRVRGGVLNSGARSLPVPTYPPAARAVRASGPVLIRVLIDTDGRVFSSEAISGHPLLRTASRNAACGASFSPTLLSGHPVEVSGIITYNYVSP